MNNANENLYNWKIKYCIYVKIMQTQCKVCLYQRYYNYLDLTESTNSKYFIIISMNNCETQLLLNKYDVYEMCMS